MRCKIYDERQVRMSAKFSIRVTNHQGSTVLNMCDADLLGRNVDDKGHVINISKNYYGEKIIHIAEAKNLLRQSSIISMVGKETVSKLQLIQDAL